MKFGSLDLRKLTDVEYNLAKQLAPRSLDICPTCGGKEQILEGSGMTFWDSPGYQLDGEHHDCDCQAQIALYARYILANIGNQYQKLDWDQYDGPDNVDQQVRDYIANWKDYLHHGFGLTFSSIDRGVGKTFAATTIAKELVKAKQKVYFMDFTQMVDAFCNGDRELEEKLKRTQFVILDDVLTGISERQTDLYALKFEVIIRHRTNYDLPTIFTTNLTEFQFEKAFPRIYSLICPKQLWVDMGGADYRKRSETAERTAERIYNHEVLPIT